MPKQISVGWLDPREYPNKNYHTESRTKQTNYIQMPILVKNYSYGMLVVQKDKTRKLPLSKVENKIVLATMDRRLERCLEVEMGIFGAAVLCC